MNPEQHAPDFDDSPINLGLNIETLKLAYQSTQENKAHIRTIHEQCPNSVPSRLVLADLNANDTIIKKAFEVLELADEAIKNQELIINEIKKSL